MREKDSTASVPLAPEDIESTVSVPLAPEEGSTGTVKVPGSTGTVEIQGSTETVEVQGSTGTVKVPGSTGTVEVQVHFDPDGEMDNYRRNLPHWRQDGALYFITFSLADSLPKEIIKQIDLQRKRLHKKGTGKLRRFEQIEYRRLFGEKIEKILDSGHGVNYLADPENGQIVANALRFFHQKRYILDEWVVMPNHVHVIIQPMKNWTIEKITHSWKSYTAHEINKRLKLSGQFWMHESYDRIIRNETELYHLRKYILRNPQKARLKKGFLLSTASVPLAPEEGSTETVEIQGSTEMVEVQGSTGTVEVQGSIEMVEVQKGDNYAQ